MQSWFVENQSLLWERDPALAGRVRVHLSDPGPGMPEAPAIDAGVDPDAIRCWVDAQLPRLVADRVGVVFGLGPHVWALKERTGAPIWVIDPSLPVLVAFMRMRSLRPLLLQGRLMVADPPEQVVTELCSQRSLTLLRHPARCQAEPHYFSEIERRLQERVAHVSQARVHNDPAALLEKAGPDSALGQLLAALPPDSLSVEKIDAFIARTRRPWGRAERLFATMNSFK